MSVFKKIQNMFGFGYNEDDEYAEEEETLDPLRDLKDPAKKPTPKPMADGQPEVSAEMVYKIFDKVVEVTNEAVPAYFAGAVNVEKQKKYLYECLDSSVKEYLKSLADDAQDRCVALWQGERDKLQKEMDNLKQRAKELETKRTEMNDQKLSAERQKRALSERVHDLENNLLKLEAEKEQLEIENRSLINKAKVANVYEADIEAMRKELETLRQNAATDTPAAPADDDEIKRLNDEIAALHQQIDAQKEEIDRQTAEINRLGDETSRLEQANEAAKIKDEMGGAMLNELQKKASDSVKNAKESAARIEELEAQIAQKDARIDDLTNLIAEKDARIEEDEETITEIQEIARQIERFEEVKNKYDERIRALKDEIKAARAENETLKSTIRSNIYSHAQQQKAMKDEIDSLKHHAPKLFDNADDDYSYNDQSNQ